MKSCAVLLCFAFAINSFAQDPAWDDDITVYGTAMNESRPVITALSDEDDTLRVFCVQDGNLACSRVSLNNGLTWGPFTTMLDGGDSLSVKAAANGQYTHAVGYEPNANYRGLWTFYSTHPELTIGLILPVTVGAFVASMDVIADWSYAEDECYVSMAWTEQIEEQLSIVFCQSRDDGSSLESPNLITVATANDSDPVSCALAYTWSEDNEIIWASYTTDRAGSIGSAVQLQFSDNQGEEWSGLIMPDSSSYPQIEPSISGYEQTILLAYSRRTGAPTQKDIFFLYSPDNGENFSPPTPITGGLTDEFQPQIVISPDGISFAIVCLSGDPLEEPCTVLMRSGQLATPWNLSEVQQVSATNGALRAGGVSAVATSHGFAAVWSSEHALGDADILFDGSWRGVAVDDQSVISIVQDFMLPAYPNPFNSTTTIPLMIRSGIEIELTITDLLGRKILTNDFGNLTPGRNDIAMDFSGIPSGSYWISSRQLPDQHVKVILIK